MEAVLMILPLTPAAIMALPASWMPIMTPRAFTSMILCQIASEASRNGSGLLKPALLTITLIEPNCFVHAAMASRTEDLSVTSTRWKIAWPPLPATISLATARPFTSSRSAITTENPSARRPAAIARPMPLAAPVTTAPSLLFDDMFVPSGAALLLSLRFLSLRFVGQSDFDALLRILSEFEGFDALGEIEEVRLNRRKIELGAGEEPHSRWPDAGRTDRALDGERLALNLGQLDRNLGADANADKGNAPAGAHIIKHRRQRGVVARGLDDQIGALAAGQLQHFGDRIARAGIDSYIDANFLGRRTAQRQRVDQDHARAHPPGRRCRAQADIAAAGHDHGLRPIGAPVCLDCVVAAGERLDQRAGLEAHPLGQLVQPFGAGLEQLRIGAVDAETEMIDLLAAFDHAFADHRVAGLEAADGLAGLDYFARPFVARDHRIVDRDDILTAVELVVRMADADCAHAHEHLVRSDRRRRQILDLKFARFVDHQCLHIRSPPKWPAASLSRHLDKYFHLVAGGIEQGLEALIDNIVGLDLRRYDLVHRIDTALHHADDLRPHRHGVAPGGFDGDILQGP